MTYLFLDAQDLAFTGPADRFQKNLAALRLLHDLETTGRMATLAERRTLAQFSAFGESSLLNRLFRWNGQRYMIDPAYQDILSEVDGTHLRRAALTAFYTPLDLIQPIWQAVLHLGLARLAQPHILEPAAGVGHFIGAVPPDLRARAVISAIELDPLTGRMLGHIHPEVTVHAGVGFEAVAIPPQSMDLVISNVPFGDIPVHDPLIPEASLCRTIHDYFLGKALRVVRPGGLVVFLTSWGTLDKQTPRVRQWLATQAVLLGAFRLPNGVFHQMSGSHSATDLIILQKRYTPTTDTPLWLDLAEADYPRTHAYRALTVGSRYTRDLPDDQLDTACLRVNRLWLDEPARVIGTPQTVVADHSLWLQVRPPPEGTAAALHHQLTQLLPCDIVAPACQSTDDDIPTSVQPASDRTTCDDPLDLTQVAAPQQARAAALAAVYQAAKTLLHAEVADAPDTTLDAARAALNQCYDTCIARYGVLADPANQRVLRDLPELAFLRALETHVRKRASGGWRADKERLFTTRTLRPRRAVADGSLAPHEALLRCLDERGTLDIRRIAVLCGRTVPQTLAQLGELIFRLPGTDQYALADAYLSGHVRAKLREAAAWAARDPQYQRHVAALTAVQPEPLGPDEMTINLNAYWLPGDVVTDFISQLLPRFQGQARYDAARSAWRLTDPGGLGAYAVEATTTWGTPRANAISILTALLGGSPMTVHDLVTDGDTERRVLNPAETVAVQEKQDAIRERFQHWVWADPDRAARLTTIYNDTFNGIRLRQYDGRHLSFPGMASQWLRAGDLADYQKAAVWQILQNPTALLAFAVGGGKTVTAIAAIIEARRMGLIRKALVVVPNNLVGQWAQEAHRLYPGMRVLAMGPEDFTGARRGTLLSRIATSDWDLVIIAHTSFKFLPLGTGLLDAFRAKETDRLRAYLEELRATATSSDDKRSLKQIESAILALEHRLTHLADAIPRDSARTITWHELGIDMLVVDEAHEFKNLYVPTRLSNIAGLPNASSQRALDLRIKSWDVIQRQGKVVFLTATPIMNTIGEAYVMQLYLQEQALNAVGIHHFDAWVSLYAQPRMAFELKPDGSGFRMHTRLASFVNVPELAVLWRQCLHVHTKAQMGLPEPALVSGTIIPVVVPPTPALTAYVQELAARADAIRSGTVAPTSDNMLKVTGDGRKAALDIRLVRPGMPRPAVSKIGALVTRVVAIYQQFAPLQGTQIVFCDLATPRAAAMQKRQHANRPMMTTCPRVGRKRPTRRG